MRVVGLVTAVILLTGCGVDETRDISVGTFTDMLAKANADFVAEKGRLRDRLVGYDPDEPTSGGGTNGEEGSAGQAGSNGEDGAAGADGTAGATGPAGADGRNGSAGRDGQDGVDGADGKDGDRGAQGPRGIAGKDGSDGQDGESCTLKRLDKKYVELRCPNSDPIILYSKLKK